MPVPVLNNDEVEEAIGRMGPDLLSQLLKNDVSNLIIATISKACFFYTIQIREFFRKSIYRYGEK